MHTITTWMVRTTRFDSSREDASAASWRRPLGPAKRVLRCDPDGRSSLMDAFGHISRHWDSPLAALQWLDENRHAGRRWAGYLSYDLAWWFEPAAPRAQSELPLFMFSEHPFAPHATDLPHEYRPIRAGRLSSNFDPNTYRRAVGRAIDYIAAGDIFQVNLAQQLRARTNTPAQDIYAEIQRRFPASYAALLDYGDFALVCNSPELFLRTWPDGENVRIETRPIKGTRPRAAGMDRELRESIKDQAELNMIVDLERNDLGRICHIGSVRVRRPRAIEEHPTVYHGAATIEGVIEPRMNLVDILQATFPGGSITGAPKIRAMQIIDELEPTTRGPYCGALGHLDADGQMQFNIAIRTMIIRDGVVRIPVGGGIVADSDPRQEYEETLVKAAAALQVLGVGGLEDEERQCPSAG